MTDPSSELRGLTEMLDAISEQVVRYRVADLKIMYCNASWAAWYYDKPAQVVGRTLDEFLSDDGREGLYAQLAARARQSCRN